MGVSIRYCSNCGVRIDPQDFESGRAYRNGAYAYCANCAPAPAPKRSAVVRKHFPETRKFVKKRYGVSWSKTRKVRPDAEYEDSGSETVARKKPSPALLTGVIAGVAVFVIIIVAVAVSSSRGSGKGPAFVEDQVAPEQPVAAKRGIEAPSALPVPEKTPAEKRLEEALSYARSHPNEFDKILDMLEAIEREEVVSAEVGAQIQRYRADFTGRWDTAAKEIWDRALQEGSAAEKSGDIAKAISVYQSVPEVCKRHSTYSAELNGKIERLKTVQEAKAAFAKIEPLLSDIDSAKGLEELRKIREQIAAFSAEYEGTEYIQKLKDPLAKLDDVIAELERKASEEEQKKREEEERKKQAELAKQEAEKRAKEWQQQKAHLEKFWAQNKFDSTALSELQMGKDHRLFNGANTTGWVRTGTQDCNWSIQNAEIVGSNRSANQSGLLITNYKRQYFWENYTFECKALVSRGAGAVMVRANVDENNRFNGTVYPINQNKWVSIKIVVKDDQVDISVDGGQPMTQRGNTWQAGFVALAIEAGGEVKFKDLSITINSVKR